MTLDSIPALIIALLFVLPGVVYQITRTRLQGPRADEQDNTSRLMRALTASTVLIGIYAVAAGPALLELAQGTGTDTYAGLRSNAREIALLGLALLVAIPAGLALIEDWWTRRKNPNQARYDPTPTAWQWATKQAFAAPGYVRVLTEDGTWVGGYFADRSHATGFPEPPALFIERGHVVQPDGTIGPAKPGSRGVWVRCESAVAVEFLDGVKPPTALRGQQ